MSTTFLLALVLRRTGTALFGLALCPMAFAAAATALSAPVNLSAPPLARTATTVLLLWDQPAEGDAISSYQVFSEGKLVGETDRQAFTARHLKPDTLHRFSVRSRRAPGVSSPHSEPLTVATKAAGLVVNVRDLGARGDGVTKDTAAIQKAISECPKGGTVLLPPGVYRVDHLELKSDMTFEVASGATLQFMGKGEGVVPTHTESLPGSGGEVTVSNFAHLMARDARNLTLTGGGRINGNGPGWWPHRLVGPRPFLLKFVRCSDIFVQDITLEDAAAWTTHALYVDRAVFSDVTILKTSTVSGANGDGIDPDSAHDVLIVGCRFGNQDDSIAIKSGAVSARNPHRQRSTERITIRDCEFDGNLAPGAHPLGIAIGSENCGGVRDVLIRDCVFRNVASVAFIKTSRERRGAQIENVRVENCVFTGTKSYSSKLAPLRTPLGIYALYGDPTDPAGHGVPANADTPVIRNVQFKNIAIDEHVRRCISLIGLPERRTSDLTFTNVRAAAPWGLHGQNLDGVTLKNVVIEAGDGIPLTWINAQNIVLDPPPSS